MTKMRLASEEVVESGRLPAWLVRSVLTGILAGLGAAASLLFNFHLF
jgi:hypothetical protein